MTERKGEATMADDGLRPLPEYEPPAQPHPDARPADIVAFLLARRDEEEKRAHAASAGGPEWQFREGAIYPSDTMAHPGVIATSPYGYLDRVHGEHIARHDPARVLARVDVDRRIIETHQPVTELWGVGDTLHEVTLCGRCAYGRSCDHCLDRGDVADVLWPCLELRLFALPDADHPDYDPNWRP